MLLVERFAVFDGGNPLPGWRGQDLMLFPGFQLDLDTGQVVPEGLGGDILFTARGDEDGAIRPAWPGPAGHPRQASGLAKPLTGPSLGREGRAVRRFLRPVPAGGQRPVVGSPGAGGRRLWQRSPGTFSSEATGSAYPVTGKVEAESRRRFSS